ncbi:MAG: NAD+ synthase [Euryarchaeota archaeon]|nr:NAD+ synthase [Euryarchaeota archaeon]
MREDGAQAISRFIADTVAQSGAKGIVIGLSGGLDSAVVAELAVKAIGAKSVLALHMPGIAPNKVELADAKAVAKWLCIEMRVIHVGDGSKSLGKGLGKVEKAELGNIMARSRMIILYHIAKSESRLVLGTGNKSELLTGYFTKWGDGGNDLQPIGDLYKTQVRELAKSLGVPDRLIKKVPTAGLWAGQTDERDLKIKYELLDQILHGIELGLTDATIARKAKAPVAEVARIRGLVRKTIHKRRMPLVPKMATRTVGTDWRE